mgnify:CR=1
GYESVTLRHDYLRYANSRGVK